MDGGQTTQNDALLTRAKELVADFATRAAAHDRDASFPFENFEALRQTGLINLVVPTALGGAGRGLCDISRIIGIMAQGDASTALVLLMHYLQSATMLRSDRWPARVRDIVLRASLDEGALI